MITGVLFVPIIIDFWSIRNDNWEDLVDDITSKDPKVGPWTKSSRPYPQSLDVQLFVSLRLS